MLFCAYVIFLLRDHCRPIIVSNGWSKDWAKQWALLWLATTSTVFQQIPMEIPFPMEKKSVVTARYLQSIKTFLTLELSWYCKSGSMLSSSEPAVTATNCETPCVCACQTRASRAWALPQELGHWFCPLNLWLSSGTAFREVARWQAGAWNWAQTWTLPPDQVVVKCSEAPK